MDEKHVSVPSIYLILWKSRTFSFDTDLVHFGLSGTFMPCLYSCTLPVSEYITVLIFPGWMVTSTMLVFLIY